MQAMVAIPKGMVDAASVIFLVFLVGGAFTVVERTGALAAAVERLVRALQDRGVVVIPACCLAFGLGGVLENMQEEIIAFVPLLLLINRRLGFDSLTAVAMSIGAAAVGAAFSPINPFQVGIAQKLAELPPGSGGAFRTVALVVALALWAAFTMRHALCSRIAPEPIALGGGDALGPRSLIVLGAVGAAFVMLVVGLQTLGWGFDELSALFFVMGVTAGTVAGLGVTGTAEAFVDGFRSMAYAGLLIGFARGIFVVLDRGQILDTIVHGLFTPLAGLPALPAAVGMFAVQTAVHFPVPSVSGQAVLTLPILLPLADLLGLSRQVAVLAYQYGAGLCELLTPTNGALMAMLAAAGVGYERWLGFALKVYAALVVLSVAALGAAILLGVS
jgi:uncharacterized ion transporter superfamily protein YfcC